MACYTIPKKDGLIFICGDLGEHCNDCSSFGDSLCDYPVANNKTCDRIMCINHATEISPDIHYCSDHIKMWNDFKGKGLVDKELKNVILLSEYLKD